MSITECEWTNDIRVPLRYVLSFHFAFGGLDVAARRFPCGRITLLIMFVMLHVPVIGCNDDSKTSGTMVEVSEEQKKHILGRRETYYQDKAKTRKENTKVKTR
jgi:hypothetical protein